MSVPRVGFAWRSCLPEHVDEPGDVRAENGRVILRWGHSLTCALTPDAAVITSDRLFRAGVMAKMQEKEIEEGGSG